MSASPVPPGAPLEDRIMDALRYMRRQSDADPNWPRAVPMDTLAADLDAEESEMVGAVNRLDKRGLLEATSVRGFGVYLRATDAAPAQETNDARS